MLTEHICFTEQIYSSLELLQVLKIISIFAAKKLNNEHLLMISHQQNGKQFLYPSTSVWSKYYVPCNFLKISFVSKIAIKVFYVGCLGSKGS